MNQETIRKATHTHFMCNNCNHKNVCKYMGEAAECNDFSCTNNPKVYGNIHSMFEPIFQWLKIHYPAGHVYFVVEANKAQMIQEYGLSVYSKYLKETPIGRIIENAIKDESDDKK